MREQKSNMNSLQWLCNFQDPISGVRLVLVSKEPVDRKIDSKMRGAPTSNTFWIRCWAEETHTHMHKKRKGSNDMPLRMKPIAIPQFSYRRKMPKNHSPLRFCIENEAWTTCHIAQFHLLQKNDFFVCFVGVGEVKHSSSFHSALILSRRSHNKVNSSFVSLALSFTLLIRVCLFVHVIKHEFVRFSSFGSLCVCERYQRPMTVKPFYFLRFSHFCAINSMNVVCAIVSKR